MFIKENDVFYIETGDDNCKLLFLHFIKKRFKNEYLVRVKYSPIVSNEYNEDYLNSLDFIKLYFVWYEDRLNGLLKANKFHNVKYYPNEYGMLFQYTAKIDVDENLINKITYLGNYILNSPIDEYIPPNEFNYPYIRNDEEFPYNFIRLYRLYNLQEAQCFNKDFANEQRSLRDGVNKRIEEFLKSFK